jgi:hypothetical protein
MTKRSMFCVAEAGRRFRGLCAPHSGLVLLAALVLTACSVAEIVSVINQAVLIAEQAAAIAGVLPPEYVAYVSAASECIAFAAEEEASSDSAGVKASKIGAQCATLVSAVLPPGTAADLVALAAKLAAAIQQILAQLPGAGALGPQVATSKPLSTSDIQALQKLAVRAHAAGAKVRARR